MCLFIILNPFCLMEPVEPRSQRDSNWQPLDDLMGRSLELHVSALRVLGRPDYDTLWDRFIPALSPAPPRRAARPQRARQRAAHRLAFASNGTSSKKEILSWQDLVRSGRLSRAQDREDPAAPHLRKVRVKHLVAQQTAYTLRIRMPCSRTDGCNGCIIAQDMSADRGSTRIGTILQV